MSRVLRSALSLFAAAALVAAADGWWQPTANFAFFRREMAGFAILGVWIPSALGVCLLALLRPWREQQAASGSAVLLGLGLGVVPMCSGLLAWPLSLLALLPWIALGLWLPARKIASRLMPLPLALLVVAGGLGLILTGPILPPSMATLSPSHYDPTQDARPLPTGPDVILVSIDTLRADAVFGTLSTEGGNAAPTPYFDQLRGRALWADYALSSSNQTLPGHVGMLTGCNAMVHGVRSNIDFPDPTLPLLSEIFHDAGYATSGTIANALLSAATGMARGYDLFSDQPTALATYGLILTANLDRSTWLGNLLPGDSTRRLFQRWFVHQGMAVKDIPIATRVLDAALPQVRRLAASPRPFFSFIHFMDPHSAYRPPTTMPGSGVQVRGSLSAELRSQVPARFFPAAGREIGLDLIRAVEEALLAGEEGAEVAARYYHLVYLEEVMVIDHALAELELMLQESGRPYVLLITADHGEQFGEHGLMEHANSLYEENLRVPFVLTGPAVTPGHLTVAPHLEDVAPTLLQLAGQEIPPQMTGLAVALGMPARPSVQSDQAEIAVRDGHGKKWIGRWSEAGDDPASRHLFDLGADAKEQQDLGPQATLGPHLREAIAAFLAADTWATRQAANALGAAQNAMLSQLGYADQVDKR